MSISSDYKESKKKKQTNKQTKKLYQYLIKPNIENTSTYKEIYVRFFFQIVYTLYK